MERSESVKIALRMLLWASTIAISVAVIGFTILFISRRIGAPTSTTQNQGTWQEYGGSWQHGIGSMSNTSNVRGAKLMNGSDTWTDYIVESDIRLSGEYGYAGLIIRASGEEDGVDSYHGYTAGVSDGDNSFFLGRADFGWKSFVHKPIVPRVYAGHWYHITLLAWHCDVAAELKDDSGVLSRVAVEDPECLKSGRYGLKSFSTGAEWKSISVRAANQRDLVAVGGVEQPVRAVTELSVPGLNAETNERFLEPILREASQAEIGVTARPIRELSLLDPSSREDVTVRGIVTMTVPFVVVQDQTGGLSISTALDSNVGIGDEVEAKGQIEANDVGTSLVNVRMRKLWPSAPPPALSVTALQASKGTYENQFIELRGRLIEQHRRSDGALVLAIEEESQSFVAVANRFADVSSLHKLKPLSRLNIRGICRLDNQDRGQGAAFAILLPSADDIEIVEGPPFWRLSHILVLAMAVAICLVLTFFGYVQLLRWRFAAILEERDRMAHEMHDTLAQSFAGIGFQLQSISSTLSDHSSIASRLDTALVMVKNSHREARNSIAALRPESLGAMGIAHALESCANRLTEGIVSINICTVVNGNVRPLPIRLTDTLIRIGYEAIANAVRHGHPKTITISIEYRKTALELTVSDDGVGFTVSSRTTSFGIRGMYKRADSISAQAVIRSAPGTGTEVHIVAPLPPTIIESLSRWANRVHINEE